MTDILPDRRMLLQIGIVAPLLASGVAVRAAAQARIVVVGGGVAGMTVARALARFGGDIRVTVIEPNVRYHTCFKSNEVLTGLRPVADINLAYGGLSQAGVEMVPARCVGIDPDRRRVTLEDGSSLDYDRLVVAPGIAFDGGDIEGYGEDVVRVMPHGWSGASQFALLKKRLDAMPEGGVFVIATPPGRFRCPPGPYERASLVASHLKRRGGRGKVLILDAHDTFSKQALFFQGWRRLYGYGTDDALIERISAPEGGTVVAADPARNAVQIMGGDWISGSVINLIPRQWAGGLASSAGLCGAGKWCAVDRRTMRSLALPDVYVLGDAAEVAPIPKSAFAAHSEAGVCAVAIAYDLAGREAPIPRYNNACFSLIDQEYGISIAMRYRYEETDGSLVVDSGGVTPLEAMPESYTKEAEYGESWFLGLAEKIFG